MPPRSRSIGLAVVGALLCLAISGCGGPEPGRALPVPPDGWEQGLTLHRQRVDAHFAGPESPLTPAQREEFTGLRFYPPDPSFRFVVTPDPRDAGEPLTLLDTKGNERHYVVHARLPLEHDGRRFRLTVYRSPAADDYLFLPFQDATTGEGTYDVGRYVEVDMQPDGSMVVDFNYAKNPYCAYNDGWACPLVPEVNRVPVAITAGELKFHP